MRKWIRDIWGKMAVKNVSKKGIPNEKVPGKGRKSVYVKAKSFDV